MKTKRHNDEPVKVQTATPEKGWRIPAPPDDATYHERAAGFVGDYRPLAERQKDKRP